MAEPPDDPEPDDPKKVAYQSPRETATTLLALVATLVWMAMLVGLLSTFRDFYDPVFVCDGDNCVEDRRPWAQRHALRLWTVVLASAALGAGAITLLARRNRPKSS